MKLTKGQIIGILVVVALFVARVYNAKQQDKNREEQQRMIQDLARQQAKERAEQQNAYYNDFVKETADSMRAALEDQRRKLDSIGASIEASKEKFNESMQKYETGSN